MAHRTVRAGLEMGDLGAGVDTGVGPACGGNGDRMIRNRRKGFLDTILDRRPAGLMLPTGVGGAVVFDTDGETSRLAAHAPGRVSISRRASCFWDALPSASTSCRMLRAPSGSPMSM